MKFFPIIAFIASIAQANTLHAAASIKVDNGTYDSGSIPQGKKMEHTFIITNDGDEPLTINGISPSCGCTAVTTSAFTILPGQQGQIKTTFDTANFFGNYHKTVTVTTNDPKSPSSVLNIEGTIVQEMEIIPESINLGQVKADKLQTSQIILTNKGKKLLNLTSITTSPQIIAQAEKNLLRTGESGIITVTVNPRSGDKLVNGFVSIKTDNPVRPEIKVSIYGSVLN